MVTHGYLMIRGDGLATTMAAGHTTHIMAGYGYPAMNGRLRG